MALTLTVLVKANHDAPHSAHTQRSLKWQHALRHSHDLHLGFVELRFEQLFARARSNQAIQAALDGLLSSLRTSVIDNTGACLVKELGKVPADDFGCWPHHVLCLDRARGKTG